MGQGGYVPSSGVTMDLHAKNYISRRAFNGALVAAAGALAAPAYVRSALASSGELNMVSWSGYGFEPIFAAFEKSTGIKINFTGVETSGDFLGKAKEGFETGAYDVVEPTIDSLSQFTGPGLIQAWDPIAAGADGIDQAFLTGVVDGDLMAVPSAWGTEALTYSKAEAGLDAGAASLANLFDERFAGKVALRGYSGLVSAGRYLEAQGKLPKAFNDSFTDASAMDANWPVILEFAIARRKLVGSFWTTEAEAQDAFRKGGCVIGQTWDSSGFALSRDGAFGYVAPAEGAMAWLTCFVVTARAKNVEQATAWAKWLATPEGSALWASAYSANPCAVGAEANLSPEARAFLAEAYPGDARQNLWWWPEQPDWFVAKRDAYAEKFVAAT